MSLRATASSLPARAFLQRPGRVGSPWATALGFLALPMLFLTLMELIPLGREIWMSFTNTTLANVNGGHFVGLANFKSVINSPGFTKTLVNTAIYTAGTTSLSLAIGCTAALVLDTKFAGHTLVRGILAAPWAVPGVAAAFIWLWMFDTHGILNRALALVSLGPVPWLSSSAWAMVSVIIVTSWLFAPFTMLVALSALQSVPADLVEASRVDGASRLATLRLVVWPYVLPTIKLLAVLLTIWSIRRWDVIDVLTGGGPVNATTTVVVATQQQAFTYQQVGVGAVYALIGIAIAGIAAAIYFALERRELARG